MADDPKRDAQLEAMFWKALRSDMTVMLEIEGQSDARPMTAQLKDKEDHGPIWFFTSSDTELGHEVTGTKDASFTFTDKGHNVWANVKGSITRDTDRATIDALWNPYVAAWYEQGKDDPKLRLLRFEPNEAKIWKDGSSLVAGVLSLFGRDPKASYEDNVAEVNLR